MRFLRWFYSGYDWPIHRDWLAWVGLALTVLGARAQVQHSGWWSLIGAPIGFGIYGWLLGVPRSFWRGYRERDAVTPSRRPRRGE